MNNAKSMKTIMSSCTAALLLTLPTLSFAKSAQAGQSMQHAEHSSDMKGMNMQIKKDMPMTGDADHDFAMMMRSHHQKGIEMAQQELKSGKDAEMKAMAKKIVADQTKEIAKLDKWMAGHKPMK